MKRFIYYECESADADLYKYAFIITDYRFFGQEENLIALKEWCKLNTTGNWALQGSVISFDLPTDATSFKLVWG